jgi:hypothetical protein
VKRRDGMRISERSNVTGELSGNDALAIADEASLKRRCSAIRPFLDGGFTPGLCPIEAKIGCAVLNRMTNLGMPISVRIK